MITLISVEKDRFELSDGSVYPVPFIYREFPHGLQYYIDAFIEAQNQKLTTKKLGLGVDPIPVLKLSEEGEQRFKKALDLASSGAKEGKLK